MVIFSLRGAEKLDNGGETFYKSNSSTARITKLLAIRHPLKRDRWTALAAEFLGRNVTCC